jgi:hypothetical protein
VAQNNAMAMAIAMVTEIKMKWYINEEAFTHTHTQNQTYTNLKAVLKTRILPPSHSLCRR